MITLPRESRKVNSLSETLYADDAYHDASTCATFCVLVQLQKDRRAARRIVSFLWARPKRPDYRAAVTAKSYSGSSMPLADIR
jgi:hypothetical protein